MNEKELNDFLIDITEQIKDEVLIQIYDEIIANPVNEIQINPAFPFPKTLKVGIVKNCLAIEYIGPNNNKNASFESVGIHNEGIDIFEFLDVNIKHLSSVSLPAFSNIENMSFFLGDSISYLTDYFYDMTQLPFEFLQMNGYIDFSKTKKPMFVSNTNFFWTDENGELKVKHIDFLEIFPRDEDGNVYYHDSKSIENFKNFILNYKVPSYRSEIHKALNDFIELISFPKTSETTITKYLADNPEILQLAFGINELNPEVLLEWQYTTKFDNLKVDFLPVRMDGYADIMEFKLPNLKSRPVVGKAERSHPSFEIDSAIAQLDMYEEWCSQKINIDWLEQEKGIKILHPKRILIIGHSKDISSEQRAKLRKIRDTTVFTYDEFIEMARFQLYRMK